MTTTFQVLRGDVVVNRSSGQPTLVADGVKLRQDLRVALATGARRDNVGAGLEDVINGRATVPSAVQREITRRVQVMVQQMQSLQALYNRDQRPREELLLRLSNITVTNLADDPTAYQFRAAFLSGRASSDPIIFTGRIA